MTTEQYLENDEINLAEFWHTLVKGKWIIIACIFISLLFASLYLFLVKEEFKAEVYLLPPSQANISELHKIDEVSSQDIYQQAVNHLKSRVQKRKFFNDQNIAKILDPNGKKNHNSLFANIFITKLTTKSLSKKKNSNDLSSTQVSLQLPTTAKNVTTLTNLYVKIALATAKKEIIDNINSVTTSKIKILNLQITNKLTNANTKRNDRIIHLKEALAMAQILNIREPIDINESQKVLRDVIQSNSTPLYYRGAKALSKEIQTLKNREHKEPFISGLRTLQDKLSYEQSLIVNPDLVTVAKVDDWAYPPEKPASPNRNLILLLSFLLGGLAGIFYVLAHNTSFSKKCCN